MGEDLRLPRINEVANFLNKYAVATQRRLSEEGGEIADLVKAGTYGGGDEASEASQIQIREGLIARATVLSNALREAILLSESDLLRLKRKLQQLRRVRFVGVVLGALGSSAVIGAAFVGKIATLITGVVALLSNIAALTADYLILGTKGSEDSLREATSILSKAIGEGHLMEQLLATLLKISFDMDQMTHLIEDANGMFAELIKARSIIDANA